MNVYIFASFLAVKTPMRTSTTTFPHTSSQDTVMYCDLDNFHSSSFPELFTLIVAHKMATEQPLFKPEIFE
jgi:predicted glycosyltransferase involved in capsule biosynthesis